MRFVVLMPLMAGLSACSANYSAENLSDSSRATGGKRASQKDVAVCIGVPTPGRDKNHEYPSSGTAVGFEIRRQGLKHFAQAILLTSGMSFEVATAAARQRGCEFLIFSEIIRWEDRLTEWTGQPDAMELRVQAVRLSDALVVDDQLLKGEGPSWTAGGHPEDLLAVPLGRYIGALDLRAQRQTGSVSKQ